MTEDGIMVAQSETPVYSIAYLKNYTRRLKERYPLVSTYAIMVPSYAGLWSLTWAAKTIDPFSQINSTPPPGLKYFTPALFKASLEMGRIDLWIERP
jgi:spermidine synthase